MYVAYIINFTLLLLNKQFLFLDGLRALSILLLTLVNYTLILLINNDLLHSHISLRTQKELEVKEYRYLSEIDGLTGIYSRRTIEDRLRREIENSEEKGRIFSIFLIDINSFKSINDTYGQNIGDSVLIYLTQLLQDRIRKEDYVGRWGGDEFLVISNGSDATVSQQMLDRFINMVIEMDAEQFSECRDIRFTFSAGFGIYQKGDNTISLIHRADKMLYEYKKRRAVIAEGI